MMHHWVLVPMLVIFFSCKAAGLNSEEIFSVPVLGYVSCLEQQAEKGYSYNSHANSNHSTGRLPRRKRQTIASFTWPRNSRLVADFYINIPLYHPKTVFMPISIQGKKMFPLPNFDFEWIEGRSLMDRFSLFKAIEGLFNHFGADGHTCVLRAICERTEYHVLVDGLLGEFVNLLLEIGNSGGNSSYSDLEEAEKYGRDAGNCHSKYSACPFSIFQWFD